MFIRRNRLSIPPTISLMGLSLRCLVVKCHRFIRAGCRPIPTLTLSFHVGVFLVGEFSNHFLLSNILTLLLIALRAFSGLSIMISM